jgi:type IV pilus biogenesis protein CpaD/CtpE
MRSTCTALLLATLAGCCCHHHEATAALPPTTPTGPVIVSLVSRGTTIVVHAGPTGPTYTLRATGGEVLIPSMTLAQLQASHPDLSNALKTMEANVLLADTER